MWHNFLALNNQKVTTSLNKFPSGVQGVNMDSKQCGIHNDHHHEKVDDALTFDLKMALNKIPMINFSHYKL